MSSPVPTVEHRPEICVVGGGLAGLLTALSAARLGARVLLMQERPMLGGNASSECRVPISGAERNGQIKNMRETGILEELRLDNLRYNRQQSFSIWDTLLFEKALAEPNLELLLNCTCFDATMDGPRIASVLGWQMTTQERHRVQADLFVDCSGDAVLAPLTGAAHRVGREGRAEFGESIAPEQADRRTMGMTCLFEAREWDTPQRFELPSWARRFESADELPYGGRDLRSFESGYWWVELGGDGDSIRDTERCRQELLRIVYGVWGYIKTHSDGRADNWALDWVGFLPGKRESRRYLGDHILTQNDIEAEGRFPDLVAYGGWTMDDHHPAGFGAARLGAPATIFHPAPSPYGIPYRSLYSRNIENLMFAGRDISVTHAALSSTRVMGTCCSIGQAVGTAAALAIRHGKSPRQVGESLIGELQQSLLWQDCYLPWVTQTMPEATRAACYRATRGDVAPLRDGSNRPVGSDLHAWEGVVGDEIELSWDAPQQLDALTLIADSSLDQRLWRIYERISLDRFAPPATLLRGFTVAVADGAGWRTVHVERDNHQRLIRVPLEVIARRVHVTLDSTWGSAQVRLYALYVDA
jgi:hypothetical protein